MPYYAQYNDQNIVFAVTESAREPVGNFIESDSFDVIGWVRNGDNIEPAPVVQQYKTRSLTAIEWRRLFLPNEPFIIDELRANINDLSYQVPNSPISLDDEADAIGLDITYRQFLRTCFNAFAEATSGNGSGIDVNDILTFPSLICFEALGILAQGRKEIIIQGVPL